MDSQNDAESELVASDTILFLARWIEEEGNVVDDITTEVIYLSPEASSQFVVTRR